MSELAPLRAIHEGDAAAPAPRRRAWGRFAAACVAGGGAAVVLARRGRALPATVSLRTAQQEPGASDLRVRVSNSYTKLHGAAGKGYPWLADGSLVEPYRDTTLWFSSSPDDDVDDGFDATALVWAATQTSNVADGASAEAHAQSGAVATWQFEQLGAHRVEVRKRHAHAAAFVSLCRII
jgi:hypothetical protein